jgi:hypothetical protein
LWVKRLYEFTGNSPGSNVEKQDIDYYINNITKSKKEWRVKQAQEAIRLYLYFKNRPYNAPVSADSNYLSRF